MISELLNEHLSFLRRINARPTTIHARRWCLQRIEAFFDGRPSSLSEVTIRDLERWQDWATRRVSPSTVTTYTSHVRAFYRWAADSGRLPENPAYALRSPRLAPGLPRPIPPGDLSIALRTARGDLLAILVLAAYLGLRAGEIAAVRGEDVVRDGGVWLIVHGKGGRERAVPLVGPTAQVLDPWLRGRGPVFKTTTGRPLHAYNVTNSVTAHFRGLGMPYTTHQLRHRAATRLLQLTSNLRQVQTILGHADPRTTAGYTAIADSDSVRAMGQLADDLPGQLGQAPQPDSEAA